MHDPEEGIPPAGRQRILVVDDDRTYLMLATRNLEQAGYQVITAGDGEEGVRAYAAAQPHLVILDLNLPGMSGFDVCRELRQIHGSRLAPVILATASEARHDLDEGYRLGATDFVTKPIRWPVLVHRVAINIESRQKAIRLARSEHSLATAQRIAKLGSWIYDPEARRLEWSREGLRVYGYPTSGPHPQPDEVSERIHPEDRERARMTMRRALEEGKGFTAEIRLLMPDGTIKHVRQQAEIVWDDPEESAGVLQGTVQDVTEQVRTMKQIQYLANFDGLTGLSNRRLFRLSLCEVIAKARDRGERIGLLFMDLDRFKRINDTLGHTAGDQLLQMVARRIQSTIRAGDSLTRTADSVDVPTPLARLGGDEFTLLVTRLSSAEDAGKVAQRILDVLARPIDVDDHPVTITTSIGIAIFPDDGDQAETLVRNADTAMYRAKEQGGNTYHYFDDSMNASYIHQLKLESRLREALREDRLSLVYQPTICLRTAKVTGMEALLRWDDPELGKVSPAEFIPVAEAAGLIVPIGEWVMLEACRQNKHWQERGGLRVPIAVNVSTHQFSHDLDSSVQRCLERTGLEARYLELEITESAVIGDEETTLTTLHALRALGIRIALDDFGTGFSSLSYLRRFPLDTLKIDRTFVMDLPGSRDAEGIVAAIIAMAHTLDLHVVAEGVETSEQSSFLRSCSCDDMQGYLVSRPVPAPEFERFLLCSASDALP